MSQEHAERPKAIP